MFRNNEPNQNLRRAPIAVLVALFVASIGLAASAGAQPYTDGSITFDPGSPDVGGSTTLVAEGFTPGCEATITVDGADTTTGTADANGDVTATVVVPDGAAPGDVVSVTVVCGDVSETGAFTVAGGTDATTTTVTDGTVPGSTVTPGSSVAPGATPDAGGPGAPSTGTGSSETLAKTGSNTATLVLVGLGLAAMGAAIVVVTMRRRRADTNA